MDLANTWQEHKRFIVTVACGAIVFAILWMVIDHYFGADLRRQRALVVTTSNKLAKEAFYSPAELDLAQTENAALSKSVETLARAAAFVPRAQFTLDAQRGSPSTRYFAAVSAVREDLLRRTGRANLRVPADLGLPALSPTREPDIARYLEALDLVERAVRMALTAGCERVDKIEIRLDPRLSSRDGVGHIERTRVTFTLSGKGGGIAQFLVLAQSPDGVDPSGVALGGPLVVEKADMMPARTGAEASLEVTFVCARIVPTERAEQ